MDLLNYYLETVSEEKRSKQAIAYLAALDTVKEAFPSIAEAILQELKDQRSHLKLIASENYSSLPVQLAMGNLLTDKYSEGYVHHRFYAGCENVDTIEEQAVFYAKKIFQAPHAYVQPHSGSDANLVGLWSILVQRIQHPFLEKLQKKNLEALTEEEYEKLRQLLINQKLMGMSLASGGHLTHGYRQNISSKFMRSIPYEVDPRTGLLDYAKLKEQALKERPLVLLAGYSAYPRLIDFSKMREIAEACGATLMVDMAHFAGLVAGKAIQGVYDPVPYAQVITSTTHKVLRGPRGGFVLCDTTYQPTVDKGCPLVMGGPMPHVMAAKALAFKEAESVSYQKYAKQVIENSKSLACFLKEEGVEIVTGGTENHLVLLDVAKSFSLTGRQAEGALKQAQIHVNRNALFNDTYGPWYTAGVRLGTPAITSLGMKEPEMKELAEIIYQLLKHTRAKINPTTKKASLSQVLIDEKVLDMARKRIKDLLAQYPLYPELMIEEAACGV